MLIHLPIDHTAERMLDALLESVQTLPEQLRRSLTWDQGSEMGRHHEFTLAVGMPVYFCDPAGPWRRGSNFRPQFTTGGDSRDLRVPGGAHRVMCRG